jgi:hypothetical protein
MWGLMLILEKVWFFLLIGQAGMTNPEIDPLTPRRAYNDTELSLTIPVTNSLAFLFTVLGEWYAEGKVISRGMCRIT